MRVWILILLIFLTACSVPPVSQTRATPLPQVAETAAVLATATVTPTQIPVPSETSAPTPPPLPPPTNTPTPMAVKADNVTQLALLSETSSPDLRRVVFSPDGQVYATAFGNADPANFGVKLWRTADGELLQDLKGYTGIVWDIAFSPDGKSLASAADDQGDQKVRIWNVEDGQLQQVLHSADTVNSVAYSPDGKVLAAGGLAGWPQGVIWLYDTATWNPQRPLAAPGQNVTALAYSPDGQILASGGTDGKIRLWQTRDGTLLKTLFNGKQANRLAFSPDSSGLASIFCTQTNASGCIKGGAAIWRTADGKLLRTFSDVAEAIAFSPDGLLFVSGSGQNDPLTRLRSAVDWKLLNTLDGATYSLAFSPDGARLATGNTQTLRMWGIK